MSTLLLLSFTVCMSLLLPLMAQPLSLGLVIMLSTLLMCCLSAVFLSSWYGYILFLIYVGGLLVMFAYVAALSPNVLFMSNYPVMYFLMLSIPFAIFIYFFPFVDFGSLNYFNLFVTNVYLKSYGSEMASPEMISILVGLGLILLINLVAVVKICYYQHASLRPFKSE